MLKWPIWLCLLPSMISQSSGGALYLDLKHFWKGQALSTPSKELLTGSGETIKLSRFAYILSSPRLLSDRTETSSGTWLRRKDWFGYVDASRPGGLNRLKLGSLPARSYRTLQFSIGLSPEIDQADPSQYPADHPLNPNYNNLHWTPQGGYIFLAAEGHLPDDKTTGGFAYHLGKPRNRVVISLPIALTLTKPTVLEIDVHIDRIFGGEHPLKIGANPSSHSREGDPVARKFKQQLPAAFELRSIRQAQSAADPKPSSHPQLIGTPYRFEIARGFPIPVLPTSPPLTNERVTLGKRLFNDPLLSSTNQQSCASCHQTAHAFSDPRRFSEGATGSLGTRNSMPLFNLAWKNSFFWDGSSPSLRELVLHPIQSAIEMHESLPNVIAKLESASYGPLFEAAFGSSGITERRLGIALEQFLLTRTSYNSRFDKAARGESELTEMEKRGFELFMTEYDPRRGLKGADCFHCHGGALFTDHRFHNNGIPDDLDLGLELVTGRETDRNLFITPSLRNIALTGPYMHDGRFETLEEVIEHYNSGLHRSPSLDPNLAKHPQKGLGLATEDMRALVSFLRTLTDPQFVPTAKVRQAESPQRP